MKNLIGKKAINFKLQDEAGKEHTLEKYVGKVVLLYFYPKDMTPGCTIEAEGFRDHMLDFKKLGVVVLGISPDSVASHAKFCEKHKLNFTLLADIDHKIADKYEVWVEKSMYGKKYMGVERDSFLINKEGIVVRQYEKVKPEEHPDEIIIDIKSLKLTK
jgi:peroxiredoxin Q/BCP